MAARAVPDPEPPAPAPYVQAVMAGEAIGCRVCGAVLTKKEWTAAGGFMRAAPDFVRAHTHPEHVE